MYKKLVCKFNHIKQCQLRTTFIHSDTTFLLICAGLSRISSFSVSPTIPDLLLQNSLGHISPYKSPFLLVLTVFPFLHFNLPLSHHKPQGQCGKSDTAKSNKPYTHTHSQNTPRKKWENNNNPITSHERSLTLASAQTPGPVVPAVRRGDAANTARRGIVPAVTSESAIGRCNTVSWVLWFIMLLFFARSLLCRHFPHAVSLLRLRPR